MKRLVELLKSLLGLSQPASPPVSVNPLDYEQLVALDAESLAEQGILTSYSELLPRLKEYSAAPLEVTEVQSNDGLGYTVEAGGRQFVIWEVLESGKQNNDGWERATVAFFQIVNASLEASTYHFYAINGGNDLFGMFLTEQEFIAARQAIARRSDWPWLPDDRLPHYGFPVEDA
ncbi:hypothetical protein IV454_22245 [Massilia antarctica]|uniref:Uncharacterized protein n=1 Tax=Massilia antarctica TaxID=2765360 RepID=A0AA48WB54_9BURK|nr:hypothetical protein [Massilia antarctica]QPI48247.1 hypothetical protein IV454_22245 [Massilia antarctica]